MSDQNTPVTGLAAGVPYVALPPAGRPDGREPAPLIIAWHLNDPPRSAAAMAAALPLAGVAAWRVYLDLPMHGRRQLPGGLDEFMSLGYQDAVLKAFEPQVSQAVDEFPAVLADLRAQLPVAGGAIGVAGASIGALPAQLVMASGSALISAAALISPVIQLAEVVAASDPDRVGLTTIPGMGHPFAAQPGIEPAPQTAEAKLVDAAVTDWFSRYLS